MFHCPNIVPVPFLTGSVSRARMSSRDFCHCRKAVALQARRASALPQSVYADVESRRYSLPILIRALPVTRFSTALCAAAVSLSAK